MGWKVESEEGDRMRGAPSPADVVVDAFDDVAFSQLNPTMIAPRPREAGNDRSQCRAFSRPKGPSSPLPAPLADQPRPPLSPRCPRSRQADVELAS
jgi:hypothetical protein